MALTVGDILGLIDRIAPFDLAEKWDNPGLQAGKTDWPVKSIWVALDPLPEVVAAACKNGVDLLITHHPLIFQPLKSIDFDTPTGTILGWVARKRLAIISAHTNLDAVSDGLNDVLAERIGLKKPKVLGDPKASETYGMVLYAPAASVEPILKSLAQFAKKDAGGIDCRIFHTQGTLTVHRLAEPRVSKDAKDDPRGVPEARIEMRVKKDGLQALAGVVKKIASAHRITHDLYPVLPSETRQGMGRVGELDTGTDLISFAKRIKRKLALSSLRVAGDPNLAVYRVAVCSGSGAGMLGDFFRSNAQVFVTGDLRYHDARTVESMQRGAIDIGHFPSEHLMKDVLAAQLRERLSILGEDVRVEACGLEKDPFIII